MMLKRLPLKDQLKELQPPQENLLVLQQSQLPPNELFLQKQVFKPHRGTTKTKATACLLFSIFPRLFSFGHFCSIFHFILLIIFHPSRFH